MRCKVSGLSKLGLSLPGSGGANEAGVPCDLTWGGELPCEPKLPSPKAKFPGAPSGLPVNCVVFRCGVTCTVGTCITSVRATRRRLPTLDISWFALGMPSTISAMVGMPC